MIDIDSIRHNNPIQSVVEKFTGQPVEKHKIFAPWRQENTPSVHIYDDGKWWDFGAGIGGDVIDFVGYYFFGTGYNPDVHFTEVVDRIGGLDIRPLPAQITRPAPPKPKLTISLEQCIDWHTTMPTPRRAYWHSRGLSDATIDSYFLGWDGKRYTIPLLYRLVPFGIKRRQSDIADGIDAKYIMQTGSRAGIFNADVLASAEACVICEGEVDVLTLSEYGIRAVCSTAGANTWKDDWSKFFSHIRNVYILYDNDDAGRNGAAKVKSTIRRAKILSLPTTHKDINEFFLKHSNPLPWLLNEMGNH